jgi:uridine kinase
MFRYFKCVTRIEDKLDLALKHVFKLRLQQEDLMATWAEIKQDLSEYKDATQGMRAAFMAVVKKLDEMIASSKDGEFVKVDELRAMKEDLDKETADVVAATLEGTRAEPTEEETHAAGM